MNFCLYWNYFIELELFIPLQFSISTRLLKLQKFQFSIINSTRLLLVCLLLHSLFLFLWIKSGIWCSIMKWMEESREHINNHIITITIIKWLTLSLIFDWTDRYVCCVSIPTTYVFIYSYSIYLSISSHILWVMKDERPFQKSKLSKVNRILSIFLFSL